MIDQFRSQLIREAEMLEITISSDQASRLYDHYSLIEAWNKQTNLTAIQCMADAVTLHYIDCLAALKSKSLTGRVMDLGSGAGFPGLVLAILLPGTHFVLAEKVRKKASFLKRAVHRLELSNVSILNELVTPQHLSSIPSIDLLMSRATLAPKKIFELVDASSIQKVLLFTSQRDGLPSCPPAWRLQWSEGFRLPGQNHERHLSVFQR